MGRGENLLARIPPDVLCTTPTPSSGDAPVVTTTDETHPREALEAIGRLCGGIVEDDGEAVTRAVREPEVKHVDVIVEDPVSSQLVEHHAPVGGNAHRIGCVRQVGELKVHVGDTVAIPAARGVSLDAIRGAKSPTMIDRDRESGAVEVAADSETQVLYKTEEAITVVVGVHGGKVVGTGWVVEICTHASVGGATVADSKSEICTKFPLSA